MEARKATARGAAIRREPLARARELSVAAVVKVTITNNCVVGNLA